MATLSKTPRVTTVTLASASAGPFDFTFRLFDADEVTVYVNYLPRTDWTLNASFVDGFTDDATITFDTALSAADVITILPDLTPWRESDLINGPSLTARLNTELARLWSTAADIKRDTQRAARFFGEVEPVQMTAGRALIANSDATGIEMGPTADEISSAQGYAAAAAGSAAIAAGLLAGARAVFTNKAAMVAASDLEAGETVATIGFSNIFDNGGGEYYLVAAGTYTADGVFYIDLTGSSLQAVLIHNGTIRAEQAGAIHGVESSAQIQAAWDGLVAWKDAHADDPDIKLIHSSRGTLQNKVTFNRSSDGTRVDHGHLDFTGSYLTAVSGGDLSDTNPMFTVRLGGITHFGTLDGGKFAAGYDFFGMNGGRTYNPEAIRCKGKAFRVRGASGSWKLHNPKGREYLQSDPEFADQANFTAIGLSLEDGDFNVYGENILYFDTPIQIDEDCVGIHLYSGHPTNGNPNYAAGSEPIYIVALGEANLTGASASTTGDKTVESGVYIWNGDFETEGDDYAQAAFGTAPFNQGADPWANNLLIHAANDLKTSTGRDVYLLMIADGSKELECFIKPATNTANSWSSSDDFTEFMYPQIRTAAQAIPGRNTLWPDVLLIQQGEANSADTAAEYAAKLVAMVADMKKEDLFHPTLTQMTAGGLAPGHAFLATHQTAVTTAATSIPSLSYVATTSLSDVGDGVHFTGASLVTLGERHAAAVSLASAGAGQPAFCNPVLIRNYATRRNFLHGYYLDNGLVLDYTDTLWPYDCTYVHNNRAAMTAPLWRIIASEAGQTAQPIGAVTNLSGLGSVGYVDDLENGYYWDGDLSGQEALYDEMVDGPTLVSTSPRNINLRGPSTDPAIVEVKPSGSITYRYTVGGTSIDLEFDPATGEVLSNAGDFRLYKQSATNRLLVGSGTVGIGEITGEGGKLEFYAGGSQQWHIQTGGTLRPHTDKTHDLGGAARWLRAVFDWTGERRPDHYGTNTTPGTTSMATAVLDWLAALTDRNYSVAATTRTHPDIRSPVTLDISGSGAPMYRIRDVDDVTLIPRNVSYTGTAFAVLMNGSTDGFRIKDGFIQTEAFALTIKPAASTGGWAENGVVSGMLLEGSATTAKTALSFDGDTRNVASIGNIVKNFQRSGDSGDGLAYAVSGDENDVPVNDDENIVFGFNVADGVAGPMFHSEDNTRRIAFTFAVGRNVDRAVQIINNYVPYLHNYIGIMVAGPADEFFRSTGTGSSKDMNLAFNLWDGAGVTSGEDYAVTLGQAATKNINLIGNIYHDIDQAVGAFHSNAEGPLNFIAEIFDTITGPCMTLAADAVQASIGNCIFNGGTYGIVGSSTARTSPATRRGILVQSTNRFEGVSTDIVQKSQSANLIGDKAATTPALDSQTASDTILFVAPRKGWLTGVTLSFPDAGGNGTTASTFTVYATNSGGSTKLIDATVTKDASQYDTEFWGSEHAQIEVNKFAAGDIIRVVCDGAEDAQTLFQIGLDWFEYDD